MSENTLVNQRIRTGKFYINWSSLIPRSDENFGGKRHDWDEQEFGRVPDEKEPSTGHYVSKGGHFDYLRIIPDPLSKASFLDGRASWRPARNSLAAIAATIK